VGVAGCFVALVVASLCAVPSAQADVSGPCDATIAGVDVRGRAAGDPDDAIPVGEDEVIVVTMSSPTGLESHDLRLEYGGIGWTVSSESDEGQTSADDQVEVADYADFGVGLYRVTGEARLVDGSVCKGSVLIDVQGNPLTTAAGVLAAGMTVAGAAGIAAATVSEARRARRAVVR
jgi:hypothetical protein